MVAIAAPLWDHPAVAAFITGQLPSLLLIADMAMLPYVLRWIAQRVVGLVSESVRGPGLQFGTPAAVATR